MGRTEPAGEAEIQKPGVLYQSDCVPGGGAGADCLGKDDGAGDADLRGPGADGGVFHLAGYGFLYLGVL